MAVSIDVEELRTEKVLLQKETLSLDEEIKQLEKLFEALDEKIAIQELRNKNAAKKEKIRELQSRIAAANTQLDNLSKVTILEKEEPSATENTQDAIPMDDKVDESEVKLIQIEAV